ncbi:MAG: protein-methionine-sulfoxide reductase catalytic subunit MsrP [Chloroflexi bacterium]|nr:protein-methionine-sulfoxide reductase catalytic subunit MsrP [Chloroflexota bacterium]
MDKIHPSEITPERLYFSRRKFLAGLGLFAASTVITSACKLGGKEPGPGGFCDSAQAGATTDELGAGLTACNDIINYNNYYEFTLEKTGVAELARDFKTSPWTVEVGGLVKNPRSLTVDELIRKYAPEERIYRLRCVEAWSMVIPWLGFPLGKLLKDVVPDAKAKYVRFTGVHDPKNMPGQQDRYFPWPYIEGLRLDEAMHDLSILATGLYGKPLPVQDGAPIRLVVPWKYGFKSIKDIVRIDLVEDMPDSFWMSASPNEYGFYANVNPEVPHPRWSQSSERRIGEASRRPTLPFNGYGEQVAALYAGMDLRKFF